MDISMKDWVSISDVQLKIFVKLRSRSGEGQVRVRKVRFGPEPYSIFGFHHPPPSTQTFFLAFKGSRQVRWMEEVILDSRWFQLKFKVNT